MCTIPRFLREYANYVEKKAKGKDYENNVVGEVEKTLVNVSLGIITIDYAMNYIMVFSR